MEEVFAEVCVGMGEALVGAYEGQSLSFAYNKKTKGYEIYVPKMLIIKRIKS